VWGDGVLGGGVAGYYGEVAGLLVDSVK
jgi:hypothetical protein